jgi:hypothetical protein
VDRFPQDGKIGLESAAGRFIDVSERFAEMLVKSGTGTLDDTPALGRQFDANRATVVEVAESSDIPIPLESIENARHRLRLLFEIVCHEVRLRPVERTDSHEGYGLDERDVLLSGEPSVQLANDTTRRSVQCRHESQFGPGRRAHA